MDLVDAASTGQITIVLATIVVSLAAIIGFLFSLIVKELRGRAERAEKLTDTTTVLLDKAVDGFQIALAELREKPSPKRR
jgi:hypothetical protein